MKVSSFIYNAKKQYSQNPSLESKKTLVFACLFDSQIDQTRQYMSSKDDFYHVVNAAVSLSRKLHKKALEEFGTHSDKEFANCLKILLRTAEEQAITDIDLAKIARSAETLDYFHSLFAQFSNMVLEDNPNLEFDIKHNQISLSKNIRELEELKTGKSLLFELLQQNQADKALKGFVVNHLVDIAQEALQKSKLYAMFFEGKYKDFQKEVTADSEVELRILAIYHQSKAIFQSKDKNAVLGLIENIRTIENWNNNQFLLKALFKCYCIAVDHNALREIMKFYKEESAEYLALQIEFAFRDKVDVIYTIDLAKKFISTYNQSSPYYLNAVIVYAANSIGKGQAKEVREFLYKYLISSAALPKEQLPRIKKNIYLYVFQSFIEEKNYKKADFFRQKCIKLFPELIKDSHFTGLQFDFWYEIGLGLMKGTDALQKGSSKEEIQELTDKAMKLSYEAAKDAVNLGSQRFGFHVLMINCALNNNQIGEARSFWIKAKEKCNADPNCLEYYNLRIKFEEAKISGCKDVNSLLKGAEVLLNVKKLPNFFYRNLHLCLGMQYKIMSHADDKALYHYLMAEELEVVSVKLYKDIAEIYQKKGQLQLAMDYRLKVYRGDSLENSRFSNPTPEDIINPKLFDVITKREEMQK